MQGCLGVASRDDGTLEENGPYKAEEKGPRDMEGRWQWEDRETPGEKAVDDEAGTAGRQSSGGLPKSAKDARGEPRTAEDARGRPRTAVTPEAGRAGEELYTGSQKEPALPIPWLQTGGLHRRERIHCCRKPLRVCCFMTPAPKMKAGSFPGNALCRVIETR